MRLILEGSHGLECVRGLSSHCNMSGVAREADMPLAWFKRRD